MSDEVVVDAVNLTQPEAAETPQAVVQLGAELLAARKAKGFTQQDVSNTLRLSLKQIEALEHNDFAALPDAMITRGFIRNYARLLGLDAEPLLASYKAQVPDKQPNALSVQSSMHQVVSSKKRQPWLLYSLLGILLGCLIAWFLFMSYLPKFAKPVAEKTHEVTLNPAPTTSAVAPLPELALPAAERQVEVEEAPVVTPSDTTVKEPGNVVSAVKSSVGSAVVPSVESRNPANLKSMPLPSTVLDSNALKANAAGVADQSVQVSPTQLKATKALAVASSIADIKANPTAISSVASVKTNTAIVAPKKVNISATGRSWVSITDKSGKVIFEKMLTAGSEESFEAEVPMNAVIGNVQATKLAFSGKSVDLTTTAKSNVAHLVLE
ncbi:MAG: RodZ domain-containing protein [Pseudomonadota bacterium]